MEFQKKKKLDEALSNPKGVFSGEKSPKTTQKQKETGRIRVLQKLLDIARNKQLGEDLDSFDTSNPQIARLNTRITQLKSKLAKKEDPNIKRQAVSLIAQKERLEAQAAKNQMRTSSKKEDQKPVEQNTTISKS